MWIGETNQKEVDRGLSAGIHFDPETATLYFIGHAKAKAEWMELRVPVEFRVQWNLYHRDNDTPLPPMPPSPPLIGQSGPVVLTPEEGGRKMEVKDVGLLLATVIREWGDPSRWGK